MSETKDAESLAEKEEVNSDRLLAGQLQQKEDEEKGAWKEREAREEEAEAQRQMEKVPDEMEKVPDVARSRAGSRNRITARRPSKKIKPPPHQRPTHSMPRRRSSAVSSRLDVVSSTSTKDLSQFELKGVQRTSTILGTGSYGSVLLLKYKGRGK